ncbi:MAG: periplasmic heavy metal sensor [candidate division WOR-3 bacterium]
MKAKVLLLSLFLILMGLSYGQPPEMEENPPEDFLQKLNLSPEQRTKIEDIKTETRKIVIPLRSQIELSEIELQQEFKKEKPDRDKIMKIAKKIHELKWQIEEANIDERLKIHSILTPEQIEKLKNERFLNRNLIAPRHFWKRKD